MRYGWRFAVLSLCPAGLLYGDLVSRPLVTVYGTAETGRDDTLWCAVRDQNGAIHFGGDGMLTFDGEVWSYSPANTAEQIRGMALAPDGRIYAAAMGELGWFEENKGAGWRYHSLLQGLPPTERDLRNLWNVFARPDGGVVFAGAHVLYWWEGGAFSLQRFEGGRRISVMQAGTQIYVDDREAGLWRVEPGRRELILPEGRLKGATVEWIQLSSEGQPSLLATTRGFLRCQASQVTPVYPEGSAFIRQCGLSSVVSLSEGRLALGTLRGGVLVIDPQGRPVQSFRRADGLPTDEIFGLLPDDENGLWAVSSTNVVRISLSSTRFYRFEDELEDHQSVALGRWEGRVADVTNAGEVLWHAQPQRFVSALNLNRHCWCAVQTPSGFYVGRPRGVERIEAHGNGPIFEHSGILSALAADDSPDALLVAEGRSVFRIRLKTRAWAVVAEGLPAAATSIAPGSDGACFLGTSADGIWMTRAGSTTAGPAAFGGEGARSLVTRGREGAIYVFTSKGGWMRPRPGADFEPILHFPHRTTVAASAPLAGEIWVIHSDNDGNGPCLARIDPQKSGGVSWMPWVVEGIGRIGVPESLYVEADGAVRYIWAGGTAGVLQIELDTRHPPPPLPAPSLALMEESDGAVTIWTTFSRLALRPALTLQTWVEGVDAGWVRESGARRRLAALRSGSYVVRARAVDASGIPGPEKEAPFVIPAPWWRRPAALGLWVVGGLLAAYGWHRIRVGALRARAAALEGRVRERTADLERVTAEKSRLVAGISHEIRNPLNGLIGLALALEDTELGARQRELLQAMRSCAAHLSGMMEDVIDFARLESGRAAIRPARCSPAEIVADAVVLVREEAAARGAEVRTNVAAGLPSAVVADATRIRQILVNFLNNAVKFAGGVILLAVGADGERRELVFSVTDSGPGLAPAERERLFQPFERLQSESPGAGLGLATSKRWAELMSGRIQLIAEAGTGCTFRLFIPWIAGEATLEPSMDPSWRVLLVEDEDYSAYATTAVAARLGLTVHERAKTESEALRVIEGNAFDLVLLDQRLPDGKGQVVCEKLRRSPRGDRTMVVAISGAPAEDSWREQEVDAFVGKPVTPEKLGPALARASRLRLLRFVSDGTPAGFRRELERYVRHLDELLDELERAGSTGTDEDVRSAAHRLQGHFRMLDGHAGVRACEQIERQPRAPEAMAAVRSAAVELRRLLGSKADA